MTKTFVLALAMGAAVAAAQEPAATPAPAATRPAAGALSRTPRIAVIDMAFISGQSALGKAYATKIEALEKQIQAEGTKKQTELQKREAELKVLQEEFEKQANSVLNADTTEKKRQEITRKTRELKNFVEEAQEELQRMNQRAKAEEGSFQGEFNTRMKPHIEAVAKEKGIDILLTSAAALTVNREFDISADVVARADADKTPVAAARPPAARPPAAAAAASPAPAPSPAPNQ